MCGDAVPVSTRCHWKSHRHLPLELASISDHKTRRQPGSVPGPKASAPVGDTPPSSIYFCRNAQEGVNRKEQREVHRAHEHLQGRTWTSQARPGCGGNWGVGECAQGSRSVLGLQEPGQPHCGVALGLFTCGDPGPSGELGAEGTQTERSRRESTFSSSHAGHVSPPVAQPCSRLLLLCPREGKLVLSQVLKQS